MSTRARPDAHHQSDADPWWGEPPPARADAVVPPADGRGRGRRAPRERDGLGWTLLRLLVAPMRLAGARIRQSPRMRRLGVRLAVVMLVFAFLACSVGVILINNVVMGRTAELGELDDRRRELRRDNALLGAKAARLSASAVVRRRAERDLGMEPARELPQFIYLDPGSRRLTPLQRQRVANRERRERLQAQAGSGAKADAATAAEPPASTEQAP